jgi:hypothetical protein
LAAVPIHLLFRKRRPGAVIRAGNLEATVDGTNDRVLRRPLTIEAAAP